MTRRKMTATEENAGALKAVSGATATRVREALKRIAGVRIEVSEAKPGKRPVVRLMLRQFNVSLATLTPAGGAFADIEKLGVALDALATITNGVDV